MFIYTGEAIKRKLNRRGKVGKIASVVFFVLTVFVLFCIGSLAVQKFVLKRKSAYLFGCTSFIIASGSMQPAINVYDIVVVRRADEDEIAEGDIITFFDKDGSIITHRVMRISSANGKKFFATKGDANNVGDSELVPYENVIGRNAFTVPRGGYILSAVTSPTGIVVFVLLFALIGLNVMRKSNRKAARHEIRKRCASGAEKECTVTLARCKHACISRFKEAYRLVRERENGSAADAFFLGAELFSVRLLHPSVIAACEKLDWLDAYLDCLDRNELDDFPFFEIRYESE